MNLEELLQQLKVYENSGVETNVKVTVVTGTAENPIEVPLVSVAKVLKPLDDEYSVVKRIALFGEGSF